MEILIAIILFGVAITANRLIDAIIYALYFILVLEIVRAVSSFMKEKKTSISILIDAFIILSLREFIVNVVKINKQQYNSLHDVFTSSVNYHVLIFAGVLVFLFLLRYIAKKTDNLARKNNFKQRQNKTNNFKKDISKIE